MSDPRTTLSLKEQIREYITVTDYVTFAELDNRFGPSFRGGDRMLEITENVVLWSNMTEEGVDALADLLNEGAIRPAPTSPLTYLIDGALPSLPVLKRAPRKGRPPKRPYWLPVTLRPVSST